MATFDIHTSEIGVFLAILLRVSLVLFLIPVFSIAQVPQTVKALISLSLTTLLYFILLQTVSPLPFQLITLVRVAIGEIVFGIIVALAVLVIFAAFQFAGEMISFEMGFGFAQVVDPQSGTQITIFSQWFQLIASLIFFALNGHHLVLKAIVESFVTVPIGGFALTSATFTSMVSLSGQLFVIGIKMAAPVMIVLFLTHVGLGMIAKFAPEINVLMVSFPLTIILGVLFLGFSVSAWGNAMEHFFAELFLFLRALLG